jgi:hypothetical protein
LSASDYIDLFSRLSARCVVTTGNDVIYYPRVFKLLLYLWFRLSSMSSLFNLKPNIGVYTDPQHNLWIDEADPSSADIESGAVPAEGEVVVEIRSTGICG